MISYVVICSMEPEGETQPGYERGREREENQQYTKGKVNFCTNLIEYKTLMYVVKQV